MGSNLPPYLHSDERFVMRKDLHYLITVKLVDPNDHNRFHDVEILVPRDGLTIDLATCLLPDIKSAEIEISNYRVIR